MVNLNDVEAALQLWAGYVARRQDGGLGYAMQSIYRLMEPGDQAASGFDVVPFAGVPVDVRDPAEQAKLDLIERVVMREVDPSTQKVILAWYLGRGTVTQKARDLGCHRDTLYSWIKKAHTTVAAKLTELLRGVRQRHFMMRVTDIPQAANDGA